MLSCGCPSVTLLATAFREDIFYDRAIVPCCALDFPCQEEKYRNVEFGRCPRVHCHGQPCLPVGQADQPRSNAVKIFCPRCEDIFFPRSSRQNNILPSAPVAMFFISLVFC